MFNRSRNKSLLAILICSMLLVHNGCADKQKELEPRTDTRPMVNAIQQAEQDWIWISGEQWHLISIDGVPLIPDTMIDLNFKQHTWLDGASGCNRYTASYIRKAEAGLKVSEILSTRMFCEAPEGVMQQESRYFHLLKRVDAYMAQPDRLDLLADGAVVLSFEIHDIQELP